MKCRNGTARAVAFAVFPADHKRRTVRALDYARGGNPYNPSMPAIPIENYASRIGELSLGQPLFQALHDLLLALLAVGVELIQFCGQIASRILFFSLEEFDYGLGNIHASGGVHAWRDAEGYV